MRERSNVELDQLEFFFQVGLGKETVFAKAGIIHQNIDLQVALLGFLKKLLRTVGLAQVAGNGNEFDAWKFTAEFLRGFLEFVFKMRYQHGFKLIAGKTAGQFEPNAAGCSGN